MNKAKRKLIELRIMEKIAIFRSGYFNDLTPKQIPTGERIRNIINVKPILYPRIVPTKKGKLSKILLKKRAILPRKVSEW